MNASIIGIIVCVIVRHLITLWLTLRIFEIGYYLYIVYYKYPSLLLYHKAYILYTSVYIHQFYIYLYIKSTIKYEYFNIHNKNNNIIG